MPSAKILEQKMAQTEALAERIRNAQAGVIVSYAGITVEQDTALRTKLRQAGVEYKVYKNSMTGLACEKAGYGELKAHLTGMNAIATCASDPVAAAKIVKEYADKIETFSIKGGFVDGNVLDEAGVVRLAEIPSKETLICKIMMGMQSPLYKLAYALQAIIDKSGEAPAEAPAESAEAPAEAPAAE
ncbi:MAG: 50S ribosomal protein L10 [Clostridia bacterium]|nr:50S ribosomal protein L10 [Clostridia bacterium]